MSNYFDEKATQISPSDITAFGIALSSRWGKVNEMIKMLRFSQLAAEQGIANYVHEVFCDSKADTYSFKLASSVQDGDVVAMQLFATAKETLGQFWLFDSLEQHADVITV